MQAMDRRQVVSTLLKGRAQDLLVVSGLGSPTWDVAAAGDDARNFYLWGAMGGALSLGLGLALARPQHRVLVLTGDGDMLMGLGALATVGGKRPDNLALCVLDNESYGETGGQTSHTGLATDLCAAARACGFREAVQIADPDGLPQMRALLHSAEGPVLGLVKVAKGEAPRVLPERDGKLIRSRFRAALS